MDLFHDIVPSILRHKKDLSNEEGFLKTYNSFAVNRAVAAHDDGIMLANMINCYPNLHKIMQYHFLLNSIRGYKRPFRKWEKRETIEDLEAVKEYYNYSNEKAKDALVLLNAAQLNEIRKAINKGGANDSKPRGLRGG